MSRLNAIACILVAVAGLAATPAALAGAVTNEAYVRSSGDGSAVAVCQLLIVVGAVVVVGLEDGLSLVTRRTEDALELTVSPGSAGAPVSASCDILLKKLRIVVPYGEAVRARSYVSGAAAYGEDPFFKNKLKMELGGPEDAAAICQHILLIDSVIIGGGVAGLRTGTSDGPLLLSQTPDGAHASCDVEVGSIEIIEAQREP